MFSKTLTTLSDVKNDLGFNPDKLHRIFSAGTYEFEDADGNVQTVTITAEHIAELARSYDMKWKQAPLYFGHIGDGPAYAWIGSLVAEGNHLYCKFSSVSPEAIKATAGKYYKFCSIEIRDYAEKGLYCRGLALCNQPRVKGLDEMNFSEEAKGKRNQVVFSEEFEFEFSETKNNDMLKVSAFVKNFAEKFNIDVSACASDEDAVKLFGEKIPVPLGDAGESSELKKNYEKLSKDFKDLEESRITDFVDSLVEQKKILPGQKGIYLMAAKSDFKKFQEDAKALKPNPLFDSNKVGDDASKKIDFSDARFTDDDNTKITYKKIVKDPDKYASRKFSDAELTALKAEGQ